MRRTDTPKVATNYPGTQVKNPAAVRAARLKYLAGRLHALGPAVLAYFIADLESGSPARETIERYVELSPLRDFIANHIDEEFWPSCHVEGSGHDDRVLSGRPHKKAKGDKTGNAPSHQSFCVWGARR